MASLKKRKRRPSSKHRPSYKKTKMNTSLTSSKKNIIKTTRLLVFSLLLMLGIMFLAIFTTSTLGKMEGYSMLPTVKNNEYFTVNRTGKIKRFDLIYFKLPNGQGEKSVRRVIGIPGDEISYKNDDLFINSKGKLEKYLNSRKKELEGGQLTEDFSLFEVTNKHRVPEDCYFVLGDNRQSAADSRDYGFVKMTDVIGKIEMRLFPFNNFKNYN